MAFVAASTPAQLNQAKGYVVDIAEEECLSGIDEVGAQAIYVIDEADFVLPS